MLVLMKQTCSTSKVDICTKLVQNSISLNVVGLLNDRFVLITSDLDVYLFPKQNLHLQNDPYLEIDTDNYHPNYLHHLWNNTNFVVDKKEKLFVLADINAAMNISRQPPLDKQNPALALRVLRFGSNETIVTGMVNQTKLMEVDVIVSAEKQAFAYHIINQNNTKIYKLLPAEHEELVGPVSINRHSEVKPCQKICNFSNLQCEPLTGFMVNTTTVLFCKNNVLLFKNYNKLVSIKTYEMFFKCVLPINWFKVGMITIAVSSVALIIGFVVCYNIYTNSRRKSWMVSQ